jgi:hypothetical protein
MPAFTWTDDMVRRLKELHSRGDSYSIIAAELGLNRNAVAGKCKRLGLKFNGQVGRRSLIQVRAKPRPRKVAAVVSLGLSFNELRRGTCKFPHGDRGSFSFCGHDTNGATYCEYHSRLAYRRAA